VRQLILDDEMKQLIIDDGLAACPTVESGCTSR
jgi:hypothetical protein